MDVLDIPWMHKARITSHHSHQRVQLRTDCFSCLLSSESLEQCDIQCDSIPELPTLASHGNLQGPADKIMPGFRRRQTSLRGRGVMASGCVCTPQVTVMYSQSWVLQTQTVTFRLERKDNVYAALSTWFDICSPTASINQPQMDVEPESRASVSQTWLSQ